MYYFFFQIIVGAKLQVKGQICCGFSSGCFIKKKKNIRSIMKIEQLHKIVISRGDSHYSHLDSRVRHSGSKMLDADCRKERLEPFSLVRGSGRVGRANDGTAYGGPYWVPVGQVYPTPPLQLFSRSLLLSSPSTRFHPPFLTLDLSFRFTYSNARTS